MKRCRVAEKVDMGWAESYMGIGGKDALEVEAKSRCRRVSVRQNRRHSSRRAMSRCELP